MDRKQQIIIGGMVAIAVVGAIALWPQKGPQGVFNPGNPVPTASKELPTVFPGGGPKEPPFTGSGNTKFQNTIPGGSDPKLPYSAPTGK